MILFSPDFSQKPRVDSVLGNKGPSRLSCKTLLEVKVVVSPLGRRNVWFCKCLPLSPVLGFIPQPSLTLLPAVGKVFQVHERG